jgi:hypothetical protein
MAIEEQVKLVVVRASSPDVETTLGLYPSKKEALPAFRELIGKADTLRVTIEPVDGDRTADNFASYHVGGMNEVQFLDLESEEQPGANGWYWTEKPFIRDAKGIFDAEGVHGPFATEQDAIDNYRASQKQ